MADETKPDASASDGAPKAAAKASPGVFVVMHDAVSNWVKGCRLTIDDLYHQNHPTRDREWERLQRLGAIKPASDPDAAALPEAEPLASPPPILMAQPDGQLTVPVPTPKKPV